MTALMIATSLGPVRSWLAVGMLVGMVLLMALVVTELQHEWHVRRERERVERHAEQWARQGFGHRTWHDDGEAIR